MSILNSLQKQIEAKGSGRTEFPTGSHVVRLAGFEEKTAWSNGDAITWNWGTREAPNEVPAVGFQIQASILPNAGSSEMGKPQTLTTIIFPLVDAPPEIQADIDTIAAYRKGDAKLNGKAWSYNSSASTLAAFLNVARDHEPTAVIPDLAEAVDEVLAMQADGQDIHFQVTVKKTPRKDNPAKYNTDISFARVTH